MKIIEITKSDLDSPFEFSGPEINVSKYTNITVQTIYLEFKEPVRDCLIDISSTLVDRSVSNPHQNIVSFLLPSRKVWKILFTPTSFLTYKMSCTWLNESFFRVNFNKDSSKFKIEKIRLIISLNGGE